MWKISIAEVKIYRQSTPDDLRKEALASENG